MNVPAKPLDTKRTGAAIFRGPMLCCLGIIYATALWGCASPPSAAPLLESARWAILDEASHLNTDAARDSQRIGETRTALESAFNADLQQTGDLDRQWVMDAVAIYAAAREELLRHEMMLAQERSQRAENLRLAADAQERAIQLLQKQDDLITGVTGIDLWRWQEFLRQPQSQPQPRPRP